MHSLQTTEKHPHVCPPSKAAHPQDRWESLFVYSYICKFTPLQGQVEGLESPMDLDTALLSNEPNSILTSILECFIRNLRPQKTRHLSIDQISTTVATVFADLLKTPERSIFWDDSLGKNVDPFQKLEGGFFTASWQFKLNVLRQLVEYQLSHSEHIKTIIDQAWGVDRLKHKKKEPIPEGGPTQEELQMVPIGNDCNRLRYWVVDDSPRIYSSSNPWKLSATFHAVASTLDEYLAVIDDLRKAAAPFKERHEKPKRLKPEEKAHINLITALESRIEAIEAESARVQRVRKKIEQREIALAQAELRQTRTRRQANRPDYTYTNHDDSEEDVDEYEYGEHENGYNDDDFDDSDSGGRGHRKSSRAKEPAYAVGQRRSTRAAVLNVNAKRDNPDAHTEWRGERRSTRLGGAPNDSEPGPSRKRARTEESEFTGSTHSRLHSPVTSLAPKPSHGAAAVKPSETAVDQIAGKKRSKYWFFAVEPITDPQDSEPGTTESSENQTDINDVDMEMAQSSTGDTDYRTSMDRQSPPQN